ncbi:MAG: hypothetical protein INR71_12200 [Terriglobus roseus]|nr:hypothetical protein [Terriglobus roseus]
MSAAGGGRATSPPEERVVCHGRVQLLKSHGGVRQWRSVWAVLRPKTFAIYKNEDEYSAQLVVPFSSIVDAVEIDPLSKSKRSCFQLIAEERTYRFCCASEDELDRWLGGFKSLLVKRKEGQVKVGSGTAAASTAVTPSLGPGTVPPSKTQATEPKQLSKEQAVLSPS